jgi:hypothetical protein
LLIALTIAFAPARQTFAASSAAPADLAKAKLKVIGTWDCAPALNDDPNRVADPLENVAYRRARSLGVRITIVFSEDGTYSINILARKGPGNGIFVNPLDSTKITGKWSVSDLTGPLPTIHYIPSAGPPFDLAITALAEDSLATRVPAFEDAAFTPDFVFHRNIGEVALRWLKTNGVGGTRAKINQDTASQIMKGVNAHEDFSFQFGKSLLTSSRPTEIFGHAEQFFTFPLTEAQAAKMGMADDVVSSLISESKNIYPVLTEAKITKVTFNQATPLNLGAPIAAKVTLHSVHPAGIGDYFLRLSVQTKDGNFNAYQDMPQAVDGLATINCSFATLPDFANETGPVVVFVDYVRLSKFEQDDDVEVLSNALGFLFNAAPGK